MGAEVKKHEYGEAIWLHKYHTALNSRSMNMVKIVCYTIKTYAAKRNLGKW
jgi:hypothetical protein